MAADSKKEEAVSHNLSSELLSLNVDRGSMAADAPAMAADSKEAASSNVHIDVRNLSGELLSMNVDRGNTVADVKAEIQRQWQTPALYQILTCSDSVLANADSIQAVAGSCSALSMTVLVSYEMMSKELDSGDWLRQVRTLQDLACLGSRAGDFAVDSVSALLDRPDHEVVGAAAKTLVSIAGPDSKNALTALTKMVGSVSGSKRSMAVTALASLAREGDEDVLKDLTHIIEHSMTCAACRALEILAVVGRGHAASIATIIGQLQHREVRVRTFAVRVLGTAVVEGDATGIAAAVSQLGDSAVEVRIAAVRTVAKLASESDEEAVAGVSRCLEDSNIFVRMAAVKGLAILSPALAAIAVAAKLEDESDHVQRAAAKALDTLRKNLPSCKPRRARRRRNQGTAAASAALQTDKDGQATASAAPRGKSWRTKRRAKKTAAVSAA